jgi:hypothetical protein
MIFHALLLLVIQPVVQSAEEDTLSVSLAISESPTVGEIMKAKVTLRNPFANEAVAYLTQGNCACRGPVTAGSISLNGFEIVRTELLFVVEDGRQDYLIEYRLEEKSSGKTEIVSKEFWTSAANPFLVVKEESVVAMEAGIWRDDEKEMAPISASGIWGTAFAESISKKSEGGLISWTATPLKKGLPLSLAFPVQFMINGAFLGACRFDDGSNSTLIEGYPQASGGGVKFRIPTESKTANYVWAANQQGCILEVYSKSLTAREFLFLPALPGKVYLACTLYLQQPHMAEEEWVVFDVLPVE